MRILIVYDSVYGNTEKIAFALREAVAGHDERLMRASELNLHDLEGADLVFFGTPTHGGRYTEEFKELLERLPEGSLSGLDAAVFDTSMPEEGQGFITKKVVKFFGHASPKLAEALEKKGARILAGETFMVQGKEGPVLPGETERAKAWAEEIVSKL
ncbi:flavodoxin family protein [Youngiibacter multivorans]|uniref:Flavodoxin n=1 Tax=Youngiibacter multivorans TaxID=937251 RepID=A0ABS4G0D8_9CLOT|nr:flavodoxin family protein [Youngiibacter multivorans]MBP1918014.1 flavodoxin [Youngiibacter multivorans]